MRQTMNSLWRKVSSAQFRI